MAEDAACARPARRGGADHRLRRPRHRHRSPARRRKRLHPEAVSRDADPQRGAPRTGPRAAQARKLGPAAHLVAAHPARRWAGRLVAGHPRPAGGDRTRGGGEQHGVADRRIGHRQGTRRAGPAPAEPARRPPVRAGELRRRVAGSARGRTVRRGGCRRCRRCGPTQQRRPAALCPGRHAVSRRGVRVAPEPAGQAAALTGRAAHPAHGQRTGDPAGRAHRRRDQPAPRRGSGCRALPGRPVLPPAGGGNQPAALARAQGGHRGAGRTFHRHAGASARCRADRCHHRRTGLPAAIRLAGQCARAAQPDRALADPRRTERIGAVPRVAQASAAAERPKVRTGAGRASLADRPGNTRAPAHPDGARTVHGDKTHAARLLGISRRTLERRCAEWAV